MGSVPAVADEAPGVTAGTLPGIAGCTVAQVRHRQLERLDAGRGRAGHSAERAAGARAGAGSTPWEGPKAGARLNCCAGPLLSARRVWHTFRSIEFPLACWHARWM